MPIDAFLFGGRRATVQPLVSESFDWEHGVFLGATMSSETTAAAAGEVGKLRFDPMAMLPFCGYNMADYFGHWLTIGPRAPEQLPRIFVVNWFRKDADGKFLWPGFGENSRVLEWVFRRCDGEGETVETPIGLVPAEGELDLDGLEISDEAMRELLTVDADKAPRPAAAGRGVPGPVRRPAAGRDRRAARGARSSAWPSAYALEPGADGSGIGVVPPSAVSTKTCRSAPSATAVAVALDRELGGHRGVARARPSGRRARPRRRSRAAPGSGRVASATTMSIAVRRPSPCSRRARARAR